MSAGLRTSTKKRLPIFGKMPLLQGICLDNRKQQGTVQVISLQFDGILPTF